MSSSSCTNPDDYSSFGLERIIKSKQKVKGKEDTTERVKQREKHLKRLYTVKACNRLQGVPTCSDALWPNTCVSC